MGLTDYHAKYIPHELTRRFPPDSAEKLARAIASAQVDLNPHQVDAALFAFASPLAPSLLEKDSWGNWVINRTYNNAAMLAEDLCKLEGFTYAPSDSIYWQQGHSTERDFI